ncbi:MAG: peptide deformylase [Microthrixaceae bacterium]
MSSPQAIRIAGDPVLRQRADEVTDIDSALVKLSEQMFITMYDAPGLGLAAHQVGVGQRFFVYDLGDDDGARVLLNPEITGSDGEWTFEEGCLSVPGQHFEVVRPKQIGVKGIDLDGNEVEFEADELLSRLIQHELDHLDGILVLDHLDDETRRDAKRRLREMQMGEVVPDPANSPEPTRRKRFLFGQERR